MPEHPPQTLQSGLRPGATRRITPQLVREVSDLVYAMLLQELRLERERDRWRSGSHHRTAGGR